MAQAVQGDAINAHDAVHDEDQGLADANRHGGYVTPFTVEGSPSLLEISYQSVIYSGGHFRCAFRGPNTAGKCDWKVFEDTFKMHFERARFQVSSGGDAPESTPSEVAAQFRRFLCPVRDGPVALLHASTLSLIGRLLPDGCYVARWHQLPLMSAEHEKLQQRDLESVLNFLPQEVRKAFSWTDFRTGAPHGHDAFLCLPRGALPDPATRAAIAAWAQRPLEEWDLCDADFASFSRTRLVLCSSHWPRMHPLLTTQPPEALDEATVEAYVARLRDAADDSARPTALLFEMQADVHLQSAYMILDGHHKVEAVRRLSCEREMAGEAPPRINFLILSPRMPAESSLGNRGPYMDENTGMQELEQARGETAVTIFSIPEAQAAAKHAAALRALQDASQVVSVLSDLCHEVQVRAEREVRQAFVARKREEARIRTQVETLKKALRAVHVPGLDVESRCPAPGVDAGLQAQLVYWEGVCRQHGVELPDPEEKKATDEEREDVTEDVDLGSLFD